MVEGFKREQEDFKFKAVKLNERGDATLKG